MHVPSKSWAICTRIKDTPEDRFSGRVCKKKDTWIMKLQVCVFPSNIQTTLYVDFKTMTWLHLGGGDLTPCPIDSKNANRIEVSLWPDLADSRLLQIQGHHNYDNYHSQRGGERRALASPLSPMHFKKPPPPPRRITLDGINKKWMGNTAAKLSVPTRLNTQECCNSRYAHNH